MLYTYNLFCQRKRFQIQDYLERTGNTDYEIFCNFLISKNVEPPSELFFNKQVAIYEDRNKKPIITIEKEESQPKPKKRTSRKRRRNLVDSEIPNDKDKSLEWK